MARSTKEPKAHEGRTERPRTFFEASRGSSAAGFGEHEHMIQSHAIHAVAPVQILSWIMCDQPLQVLHLLDRGSAKAFCLLLRLHEVLVEPQSPDVVLLELGQAISASPTLLGQAVGQIPVATDPHQATSALLQLLFQLVPLKGASGIAHA